MAHETAGAHRHKNRHSGNFHDTLNDLRKKTMSKKGLEECNGFGEDDPTSKQHLNMLTQLPYIRLYNYNYY